MENPPRDHDSIPLNPTGPSWHSAGHFLPRQEMYGRPNHSFGSLGAPFVPGPRDIADFPSAVPPLIPKFHEGGILGRMMPSQEILTFRLLCPDERAGGVIGKGGTIIRSLKQDTGCEIKVVEGTADSEERVIVISGPAV